MSGICIQANEEEMKELLNIAIYIPREYIACDAPYCYKKNPAKKCSRCNTAFYCDKECQLKDWKGGKHKEKCSDVKEIRNRIEMLGNCEDVQYYQEQEALNSNCFFCDKALGGDTSRTVVLNGCGHGFCIECIRKWYIRSQKVQLSQQAQLDVNMNIDPVDLMQACPSRTCEHPRIDPTPIEQINARAYYYERLGDSFQNPLSEKDRMKFGRMALIEITKAIAILETEENVNPICTGMYMTKARILNNLQEYEKAINVLDDHCKVEDFQATLELLSPESRNSHPSLNVFETKMMRASVYYDGGQLDKSLQLYEEDLLPSLRGCDTGGQDEYKNSNSDTDIHMLRQPPFAIVEQVVAYSPADDSNFKTGDKICSFGQVDHLNCIGLEGITNETSKAFAKGASVKVVVVREEKIFVTLQFTPKRWDGGGLLGCAIAPIIPRCKMSSESGSEEDSRYDYVWDTFRILCRIARIRYKQGKYDECIQKCDMVLAYHRHVDEVYEWKALSHKALGNWDKAIETMNIAILYETPGNDRNTARLVQIYQDLICASSEGKGNHTNRN